MKPTKAEILQELKQDKEIFLNKLALEIALSFVQKKSVSFSETEYIVDVLAEYKKIEYCLKKELINYYNAGFKL